MEDWEVEDFELYLDLLPHHGQVDVLTRNIYCTTLRSYTIRSFNNKHIQFDDEDGYLIVYPGDSINFRYEVISKLGKGSYGEVYLVFDHKSRLRAAVKVLRNMKTLPTNFKDETRKLEILNKRCDNSLQLYDHFIYRNHPCMVFEVLDISLYDAVKHRQGEGYTVPEIKDIMWSLLHCLLDLKKVNLIHCDLKPDNVVFVKKGKMDVKIIDFGSSIFFKQPYISYIQKREYRAPEILLRIPFGFPIDMWCVGIIAAELYRGKQLFPALRDDDLLIAYMAQIIGVPPKKLLEKSEVARQHFEADGYPKYFARKTKQRNLEDTITIGPPLSLPLSAILYDNRSTKFAQFVKQCLTWDASDRITVEQALNHPWFVEDREY